VSARGTVQSNVKVPRDLPIFPMESNNRITTVRGICRETPRLVPMRASKDQGCVQLRSTDSEAILVPTGCGKTVRARRRDPKCVGAGFKNEVSSSGQPKSSRPVSAKQVVLQLGVHPQKKHEHGQEMSRIVAMSRGNAILYRDQR
jgi:hypothetical protein